MKYIDTEKLIAEIERLKSKYRHNGLWTSSFQSDLAMAKIESMNELLSFLDSLQQEQPIGEEYAIEIGKHTHILHVGSQSDIDNLIRQEKQGQTEVDLEKASRNVYESWMGGTMDDVRRDMVELGKVLNTRKGD